jgi:hypothetical protein
MGSEVLLECLEKETKAVTLPNDNFWMIFLLENGCHSSGAGLAPSFLHPLPFLFPSPWSFSENAVEEAKDQSWSPYCARPAY